MLEEPRRYIRKQHRQLKQQNTYILELEKKLDLLKNRGYQEPRRFYNRDSTRGGKFHSGGRNKIYTHNRPRSNSNSHYYDNQNRDRNNHYYNSSREDHQNRPYNTNRDYHTTKPSTSTSASYDTRNGYDTNSITNQSEHARTRSDSRDTKAPENAYNERQDRKTKPIVYNNQKQLHTNKDQTSKTLVDKDQQDQKTIKRKTGEPKRDFQEAPKRQRSADQETHTNHDKNIIPSQNNLVGQHKVENADTLEGFVPPQDILDYEPEDEESQWCDEPQIESEPQAEIGSSGVIEWCDEPQIESEPQAEIGPNNTDSTEESYKQKYLCLMQEMKDIIVESNLRREKELLLQEVEIRKEMNQERRDEIKEMEEIKKKLQGDCCKEAKQEINTLKDRLVTNESDLEHARNKETELSKTLSTTESTLELEKKKFRLERERIKNMQSETTKLTDILSEQRTKIDKLLKRIETEQKKMSELQETEQKKISELQESLTTNESALKLEKEKGENLKSEIDRLQKKVEKLQRVNGKLTNLRQRGDQVLQQFVDQVKSSKDNQKHTLEDGQFCNGYCQQVIINLEDNIKTLSSAEYAKKQQHLHSALSDLEAVTKNSRDLKTEDKAKLDKCENYLKKLLKKISESQAYWTTSLSSKNDSPQQSMNIYSSIKAAYIEGIQKDLETRLDFLQRYIENKKNPNEDDDRLQTKIQTAIDAISAKTTVYNEQSTNVFYWALVRKHCQTINLKHIIFTQRCRYLCKQFPELKDKIISDTQRYIEEDVLHVPKIFEEIDVSSLDEFIKLNYIDITRTLPKMLMATTDVELDSTCQSIPPVETIEDVRSGPRADLVLHKEELVPVENKKTGE